MSKNYFKIDERNRNIAMKVMSVMYILTIIAMQAVSIYRQFSLGQNISEFEDFAIILTVNTVFLIAGLLYFGAIPIQKIQIKTILLFYLVIVVMGSVFTYFKYNVFQDAGLSMPQLLDKLLIIFAVTGLLVLFFVIFSILGKRKIDKDLE